MCVDWLLERADVATLKATAQADLLAEILVELNLHGTARRQKPVAKWYEGRVCIEERGLVFPGMYAKVGTNFARCTIPLPADVHTALENHLLQLRPPCPAAAAAASTAANSGGHAC